MKAAFKAVRAAPFCAFFISEACTLEPGAIILTGTPSGVGEAFKPPKYLQPGDTVRVEVEGLGALEHLITT